MIAGGLVGQTQQPVTTYYATFSAQTPTSPGYDSGGHGYGEFWVSTNAVFVLSGAAETVRAVEVLGYNAGNPCLREWTYPAGEGGEAPCQFGGSPQFVKVTHGAGVVVDSQLSRTRSAACATQAGLPQGFCHLPTYHRLFGANERCVAGPVELRTQQFALDCASPNQVYDRRVNVTLANYGTVPATFSVAAYPYARGQLEYRPVWSSSVVVGPRSVTQVNNVPIPRTLTEPDQNRIHGSMSVWLTVTSDQPYLGYVSSVFEGGEPGSLPFQVFALRGQAATPGPQ